MEQRPADVHQVEIAGLALTKATSAAMARAAGPEPRCGCIEAVDVTRHRVEDSVEHRAVIGIVERGEATASASWCATPAT